MKIVSVDLYEYFSVKKPKGGEGKLTCYLIENSVEINEKRENPAMLVVPGGGYGMVSDREAEPIALAYLSRGFSCFILKYSIAPIRFPYQLTEAVMAMNYIRLNAEEFCVNKDKVSAVGFSAGGHLCSLLATIPNCDDVKAIFNPKVDARPNAVVLSYPVITSSIPTHMGSFNNLCGDDLKLIERLDALKLVDKNSSPAFIWATYEDGAVPPRNSVLFAEACLNAGVPFSIHIFGKGRHGLSLREKTVYGKNGDRYDALDESTKSASKWVDLSVEWLEEMGLYIDD